MNVNFSGVWKANLKKSKLVSPKPKVLLAKINHSEPDLSVKMIITKPDGSEDRLAFRGLTTAEEVSNLIQGIQVRSRSRWVGTELLIESWMSVGDREAHFCDYWSLSNDGQNLIMEHRNDDLAGHIMLLEKVQREAQ